jgi:hypothetical protein
MAKRKGVRGDVEAIRVAMRPRMPRSSTSSTTSGVIPPHTHHLSQIVAEPETASALLAGDDGEEQMYELGIEKLARSGEQPWLGPAPLDMAGFPIENIDALSFELAPEKVAVQGDLLWNPTSGIERLEMVVSGGAGIVKTPVGGVYVKVRNESGTAISAMKAVRISGATGNLLLVAATDPFALPVNDEQVLGITMQAIADDAEGWVCRKGYVGEVDTSAFAAGDVLYLDAAGAPGDLATDVPEKGCFAWVRMARVITVGASGSLWVQPDHRPDLDELANVSIGDFSSSLSGPVAKATFDVPMWLPDPDGEGCDAWRDTPANRLPVRMVTADYAIDGKDAIIFVDDSAGDVTITMPNPDISLFSNVGLIIKKTTGGGNVTIIEAAAGDTIEGSATFTLVKQAESVKLQSFESDVWRAT